MISYLNCANFLQRHQAILANVWSSWKSARQKYTHSWATSVAVDEGDRQGFEVIERELFAGVFDVRFGVMEGTHHGSIARVVVVAFEVNVEMKPGDETAVLARQTCFLGTGMMPQWLRFTPGTTKSKHILAVQDSCRFFMDFIVGPQDSWMEGRVFAIHRIQPSTGY